MAMLMNFLILTISSLSHLREKKCFRNLVLLTMQSPLLMFLLFKLFAASTHEEILRQQTSVVYPLDPEWQSKPFLYFDSECWNSVHEENTFCFRLRFRHIDFFNIMYAFGFLDTMYTFSAFGFDSAGLGIPRYAFAELDRRHRCQNSEYIIYIYTPQHRPPSHRSIAPHTLPHLLAVAPHSRLAVAPRSRLAVAPRSRLAIVTRLSRRRAAPACCCVASVSPAVTPHAASPFLPLPRPCTLTLPVPVPPHLTPYQHCNYS